jgi:DNA-binding NarL/FixJ family response regulator
VPLFGDIAVDGRRFARIGRLPSACADARRLLGLAALGGGRAAPEAVGLAALPRRESQIAGLVAEGLTNREIGGRLFLSDKTIEAHLSRIFGKLAVRGRAEVAARVSAEPTPPGPPHAE